MPLDSHSYLVSQGWSGNGTGLRQGAISRPLAIPQKKTLAGLGKDRDEAFPFWDHIFSAAAKSIQLRVSNSSDADSDDNTDNEAPNLRFAFKRTSTGILSNRQPVNGIHVTTSESTAPANIEPRHNLLAAAKREAAKRHLYSNFFRGPVLAHDGLEQDHADGTGTPETVSIAVKEPKKKKKRKSDDVEKKGRKKRKRSKDSAEGRETANTTRHMDNEGSEVVKNKSKSKSKTERRKRKRKLKDDST